MKILISPGFGAGWSTWMHDGDEADSAEMFALTYKPLIEAISNGRDIGYTGSGMDPKPYRPGSILERFVNEYTERFGSAPYLGGADDLEVTEVGAPFRIHEYDGSESVEYRNGIGWIDPDDFTEDEQLDDEPADFE